VASVVKEDNTAGTAVVPLALSTWTELCWSSLSRCFALFLAGSEDMGSRSAIPSEENRDRTIDWYSKACCSDISQNIRKSLRGGNTDRITDT
jgi:hypothetical protein